MEICIYGPHCIADLLSAVFHIQCKSLLQYVIVFHMLYIIVVLCISVLKNESMWERSLAPAGGEKLLGEQSQKISIIYKS